MSKMRNIRETYVVCIVSDHLNNRVSRMETLEAITRLLNHSTTRRGTAFHTALLDWATLVRSSLSATEVDFMDAVVMNALKVYREIS